MGQVFTKITGSLGSLNAVTDSIRISARTFDLSISGTWAGTVTFQRSFDNGSNWHDVKDYTSNTEDVGEIGSDILGRCKMTAYTSGTAVVGIYTGQI